MKKHFHLFPKRKLTASELRAICFVATLTLGAVAIITKNDSPVIWTFLGAAIGALYGQAETK